MGQKFEDGWSDPKGIYTMAIVSTIGAAVSVPIVFFDSPYIVGALFWALLHIGAFVLPGAYQVILDFVEPELRPHA